MKAIFNLIDIIQNQPLRTSGNEWLFNTLRITLAGTENLLPGHLCVLSVARGENKTHMYLNVCKCISNIGT